MFYLLFVLSLFVFMLAILTEGFIFSHFKSFRCFRCNVSNRSSTVGIRHSVMTQRADLRAPRTICVTVTSGVLQNDITPPPLVSRVPARRKMRETEAVEIAWATGEAGQQIMFAETKCQPVQEEHGTISHFFANFPVRSTPLSYCDKKRCSGFLPGHSFHSKYCKMSLCSYSNL